MRVVISDRAEIDLEEVFDYIALDSVLNARKYLAAVRRKMKGLGRAPRIHPVRDELPDQMRSAVHGSHLILYVVKAKSVEIARVVHGARDLPSLFEA